MRRFQWLILSSFLVFPLAIGCGRPSEPAPVAAGDDIEAFLAENPDMAVDPEEEAALMAGDAAEEEE